MTIEIDGEELELNEDDGTFLKSVCLLIDKSPVVLVHQLLMEYIALVKKEMNIPRTN